MATPLIKFDGLGEDLLNGLNAAREATAKLREETVKENDALKKMATDGGTAAKQVAANIEATADALVAVNKNTSAGQAVAKGMNEASKGASSLSTSVDQATDNLAKGVLASDQLAKSQRQIRSDALKVTEAIAAGNVEQAEGVQILDNLSKEYKQNAVELAKIQAAAKATAGSLDQTDEPVKTLKTQLREAKIELDKLIEASNGRITPELIAAAQKAGELSDRMGDLNATVEAFNPDTKFKAVLGVLGNLTGGIQAATAGMGLFGAESEDANKALLKAQQASAFFQGIQSAIGGLADNWKNLKAVIAASTIATQADTTAKGANAAGTVAVAGANTAAAGATGVFTTALNAMKAALLSNPITAIAVAVLALGAAFVSATSDNRDYNAELDETIGKLDELANGRIRQIEQNLKLKNIEAERAALEAGETEAAKRRSAEEQYLNKRAALVGKQLEFELNMRALIVELESLEGKNTDSAIAARKRAIDKLNEYTGEFQSMSGEIRLLDAENTNQQIANRNKEAQAFRQSAQERKRIEEQLAKDIEAAQKGLATKTQQFIDQGADPSRRIELQREANLKEIADAKALLLEKKALFELEAQLGAERFSKLSEAQKKFQADELVKDGEVKLDTKQEEQIAAALEVVWNDYYESRLQLAREKQSELLALQADGFEKERAEFDIQLEDRVQKLREAGATQVQIEKFIQQQRDDFRKGQVATAIDQEEALAIARVDAQERGAETELSFRRRIELEKLAIQQQYAEQRLAAIEQDGSDEAALQTAILTKTVNDVKAEREKLAGERPKFDLFALLGIDISDEDRASLIDSLKGFGDSMKSISETIRSEQEAQVEAQINATDRIIEDQQRRRDELQAQLEQALKDEEDGYANNADAIRGQIEETKRVEAEAQADKVRLLAEEKRLAAQRIKIDSAVQASAILTANAHLFAKGALTWPVGIAAAIAAGAALLATFLSMKAQLRASTADAPALFRGTTYVKRGNNPAGRDTIPAYLNEGEAVVPTAHAAKRRLMVEGLVENDRAKLQRAAIAELMGSAGITMAPERVREIVSSKEKVIERRDAGNAEEMEALRKEVRGLREDLLGFKEQERTREHHDGKTTTAPNRTTTKR